MAEIEQIELRFTPTAQDHLAVGRRVNRRLLKPVLRLYVLATLLLGLSGIAGLILLFHAASFNPDPDLVDLSFLALILVLACVYGLIFIRKTQQKYLYRRIYAPQSIALGDHVLKLGTDGLVLQTACSTSTLPWPMIAGIEEDAFYIYFITDPTFNVFIPKRIAGSELELHRLREAIAQRLKAS
jgi:hypothetical protein